MKVAIFGSGRYYQILKKCLLPCDIQFIIDNDEQKQGTQIDGLDVYAPKKADFSECDYVVILVNDYCRIVEELACVVPIGKIIPYTQIGCLLHMSLTVRVKDKELTFQEWLRNTPPQKIMIISTDLSRSGVPIALMNLSILLKKMNCSVVYVSMLPGNLSDELLEHGIDYVVGLELFNNDPHFFDFAREFDLFVIGSVTLSNMVPQIANLKKPVIWWSHESILSCYKNQEKPTGCFDNIYYYAGGKRVIKALKEYLNVDNTEELLYYLPENHVRRKNNKLGKLVFALIGFFSKRKAQDILVAAAKMIPHKYQGKYEVFLVGDMTDSQKRYYESIHEKHPEIRIFDEMKQTELEQFYETIDVLVCPSRDDPMPIVVTEAMEYGIPCIVSDQVGQEEFIENGVNGFVFENENVPMLAGIMEWIMEHPLQLSEIGKNGRKIFDDHFSEEHMRARMTEILKQYSII